MNGGYLAPFPDYAVKLKPIVEAMEARASTLGLTKAWNYILGSTPDFTSRAAPDPPGQRGYYNSSTFLKIVDIVRPLANRAFWDLHFSGHLNVGEGESLDFAQHRQFCFLLFCHFL